MYIIYKGSKCLVFRFCKGSKFKSVAILQCIVALFFFSSGCSNLFLQSRRPSQDLWVRRGKLNADSWGWRWCWPPAVSCLYRCSLSVCYVTGWWWLEPWNFGWLSHKKMVKWGVQGVYVCMLLVMILCWGSMFHPRTHIFQRGRYTTNQVNTQPSVMFSDVTQTHMLHVWNIYIYTNMCPKLTQSCR